MSVYPIARCLLAWERLGAMSGATGDDAGDAFRNAFVADTSKVRAHLLVILVEVRALGAQRVPRFVREQVTVRLAKVHEHLQCRLCRGYLRDPMTIKECLHTCA